MSTSTTPPEADTTTTPHTTTETAADATIGELPAAVAAPDVTTPEQLAALKERYIALRLQLDKITDDEIAAREAAIAAGADENELDRQEMIASMESDEHDPWSVLWDQISALKLPDPSEIAFPLIELAADFRREHNTEGARLFRYHLANQDVWQLNNLVGRCYVRSNDFSVANPLPSVYWPDLTERIKVYIIVKTRQSKTTDSAGNASYTMTVESVQNMWILFRHLVSWGGT